MGEVDGMGREGWVPRGPGGWDFSPVSRTASAISWEILLEGSAPCEGRVMGTWRRNAYVVVKGSSDFKTRRDLLSLGDARLPQE